jgi:hypothetical protein
VSLSLRAVRIRLDRPAVAELLKSTEVEEEVVKQAERVRDAIGGDWEVDEPRQNKNRVIVEVTSMDPKAHWSEAEHGRIAAVLKGLTV